MSADRDHQGAYTSGTDKSNQAASPNSQGDDKTTMGADSQQGAPGQAMAGHEKHRKLSQMLEKAQSQFQQGDRQGAADALNRAAQQARTHFNQDRSMASASQSGIQASASASGTTPGSTPDSTTGAQTGEGISGMEAAASGSTAGARTMSNPYEENMRKAISDLERLAGRIDRNEVTSAEDFKPVYRDFYGSMAWYHYSNAQNMMRQHQAGATSAASSSTGAAASATTTQPGAQGQSQKLGRDIQREMRLATDSFERWADANGTRSQLSSAPSSSYSTLRTWNTSDLSSSSSDWASGNVGQAITSFGDEMRRAGLNVTASSSTTGGASSIGTTGSTPGSTPGSSSGTDASGSVGSGDASSSSGTVGGSGASSSTGSGAGSAASSSTGSGAGSASGSTDSGAGSTSGSTGSGTGASGGSGGSGSGS